MAIPDFPAATALTARQIETIIDEHCYPFSDVGVCGTAAAADAILAALTASAAPSAAREGEVSTAAIEAKILEWALEWGTDTDITFMHISGDNWGANKGARMRSTLAEALAPLLYAHPPAPASDQAARVAELEAVLRYARRFVDPDRCDVSYIDAALGAAT